MEERKKIGETLTLCFWSQMCNHAGVPFESPVGSPEQMVWALNSRCYKPLPMCATHTRKNKTYGTSVIALVKQMCPCLSVARWRSRQRPTPWLRARRCCRPTLSLLTQSTTFKLTHHTPNLDYLTSGIGFESDPGWKIWHSLSEAESSSERASGAWLLWRRWRLRYQAQCLFARNSTRLPPRFLQDVRAGRGLSYAFLPPCCSRTLAIRRRGQIGGYRHFYRGSIFEHASSVDQAKFIIWVRF